MFKRSLKVYALSLFLIAAMLIICAAADIVVRSGKEGETEEYNEYRKYFISTDHALEHIGDDYIIDDGFVSHLPLVILDTGGTEPPINVQFHFDDNFDGGGYNVPIEGVEPYVKGRISIINSEGVNSPGDVPQYTGRMEIKRRGNSSAYYEKAQWLIKLIDDDGNEAGADLLRMGSCNEWVLNGSITDKSLFRNHLAYSVISKIMPYTPESRFCEVLIKDGEKYEYHGVYLLAENIKKGESRVDITDQKSSDIYNSYILKRDRYNVTDRMLENYGRLNGLSREYISIVYPSEKRITQDMEEYINADINKVEEILYSDDADTFSLYDEVINVDSFVDYFLVNEYFGNYDAGNHSTFCYKDRGGKLSMGPVWDFDGAMDNYIHEPFDLKSIAFSTKPWFDRLCLDKRFLKKLEERYLQLRRGYLSDRYVQQEIDDTVHYLGAAIDREWYRWRAYHTKDNELSLRYYKPKDGELLYRNTKEYTDEVYRIKTMLCEHARYIYSDIEQLEDSAQFNTGREEITGWLLLLAVAAFSIPAIIAVYREGR